MDNNQNSNNASIPNPLVNSIPVNNNMGQVNNNQVVSPQPVNNMMVQPTPVSPSTVNVPNNNQVEAAPTRVAEEPTQGISITPEQMQANDSANHLNDMNVNGAYNHMDVPPKYVNDQQITNNVQLATGQKKVTVQVSKELKTVIIIALILLAFIFVLPMLGDMLTNLKFR